MLRFLRGHPALVYVYSGLALAWVVGVALVVDLRPRVGQDFFFSDRDVALADERRISDDFRDRGSQVVLDVAGDVRSPAYLQALSALSQDLARSRGVESVQSVTHGPKSVKDAFASPLWRRLLVAADARSTLVLVGLAEGAGEEEIVGIERTVGAHDGGPLDIHVSGVPYVVELIRRSLERDMLVFTSAAIVAFGLLVLVLFRSAFVLAGTMVTCLSAASATVLAARALGVEIGVLTANIVTLVFIMTLHHVIYLTYAWREAAERHEDAVERAVREMLPASGWVMLTTLLGFGSLLLVPAQPLRELGTAGAAGAVLAAVSVNVLYPSFLQRARPPARAASGRLRSFGSGVLSRKLGWVVAGLVLLALAVVPGVRRLDRDPSLLAYFDDDGEIRRGLEQVDRNGGSSPLRLVIEDRAGARLDDKVAYRRMWALQRDLERHPAVGGVVSLPLLMAEGKRAKLGFLFSHRFLLERMESPKHDEVARRFVTENRRRALFLLRMRETYEDQDRLEVVDDVHGIVRAHGFEPSLSGGLYALQGRLSRQVVSSLVTGVGQLLLAFLVVAFAVSRSWRGSLALVLTLGVVPAIVLGALGLLRVPLDIISAPAINLALGMAIDDMIHMTDLARRYGREGLSPWKAWVRARSRHWRPLLGTAATVATGFAIFLLSSFPPTRRFGMAVIGGALVDVLACLVVLPYLAGFLFARRSERSAKGTKLGTVRQIRNVRS
jgi:predicted RND superfamily exporter protein